MSEYKLMRTVIQDEELQESIHKFKVDYQIDDENSVTRIALYELMKEEGYL